MQKQLLWDSNSFEQLDHLLDPTKPFSIKALLGAKGSTKECNPNFKYTLIIALQQHFGMSRKPKT